MPNHIYKKYFSLFLIFTALAFIAPSAFVFHSAFAQTSSVDDLRQNITSREEEIKQLEAEIADYKVRINAVGNQKKTLQTAVQTIDLSRAKLAKDIQLTQKKIDRTKAMIVDLNRDIGDKETKIQKNKEVIADVVFRVNQNDEQSLLEMLLGDNALSTVFEDMDELAKLQVSLGENIRGLETLKTDLGVSKNSYQKEAQELTGLNTQLADQKQIADNERTKQSQLLATTKNQESAYKKMLADREARKQQFEREINDFEAQLRAAIDPHTFPLAGTKVFTSPIDSMFVTQKFGKTVDAQRLYVSGTHNGTDFRAPLGTSVKAPLGGVIAATGDTDRVCPGASYGRWVLIKHPNGLSSLYAHFELIKVVAGQMVNTGDVLGYSGNTGYSTGPHLHVSLYVSSAVEVVDLPSKSCKGAIFHLPVAPMNAYLDFESYL